MEKFFRGWKPINEKRENYVPRKFPVIWRGREEEGGRKEGERERREREEAERLRKKYFGRRVSSPMKPPGPRRKDVYN